MKSNQQVFQELNLRPKICEEKSENPQIDPSDDITQTVSFNIQSLNSPISAPNTGFTSTQVTGAILIAVSSLAVLTAVLVKK